MKICKSIALVLAMVLSFSYLSVQQTKIVKAEEKSPLKIEKIIGLSKEPGTFRRANGLAVAKDGTIFIGDSGESQIEVYDANYKYLRTIGSLGNGEDQFQFIQSIHLDEDENLYVLDYYLGCIKVFSKEGVFLRNIGRKGYEVGQLESPIDFIFLKSGNLLIIDYRKDFLVFTREGKFVEEMEFKDANQHSLGFPNCIKVDEEGDIYIGAIVRTESKFFKFNQSGIYLGEFLTWQRRDKYAEIYPMNLNIVGEDLFFSERYSIKKYKLVEKGTKPATYIETIAEEIKGKTIDKTSVIDISGLVCTKDKIYYLDSLINRVIVVSYNKEILGTIESSIREYEYLYPENEIPKNILSTPMGITIGPDHLFYVVNRNLNKVCVYNPDWEETASFGQPVQGKKKQLGELIMPNDVAVNRDGYIFVSDMHEGYPFSGTIEVFNKDFLPIISIPIKEAPMGMDFDSQGNLIVAMRFTGTIIIYDLSKIAERKITKKKSLNMSSLSIFLDFFDIAVDKKDNMILSSCGSRQVFWINPEGNMFQNIGGPKFEDVHPIQTPKGVCLDGNNDLYVVDQEFGYDGKIFKYSQKTELIWKETLKWYGISFIAMNSKGLLYVTDTFHNVILVLSDSTAVPPVPKEPTLDESSAEFSLSVDQKEVTEQDTFTLSINVENLDKTSSLDMTLQYPDSLLQVESCGLGDVLKSQSFDSPSTLKKPGTIQIKSRSQDRQNASGSGILFELTLKALKSGLAYLDFGDIILQNSKGEKVSYAGKRALTIVIKSRVASPPPLTVKQVPKVVYDPDLRIEGVTNPGITVTINKKEVSVKEDGSFQTMVALTKGVNTIRVEATNQLGDKSTETILVTRKDRIMITLTIGSKVMVVNAKPEPLDAPPYIDKKSGRTMVPVRAITQTIGATISFDAKEQKITISEEDTLVTLWIGKPIALINGVGHPIDSGGKVSPVIVGGRTFVPLRFIAESFNFQVDWDPKTQKITLRYPK